MSNEDDKAHLGGQAYGFYPQMKAEAVTFTEDKSPTLVNGTNPGFQNGVLHTVSGHGNFKVEATPPTLKVGSHHKNESDVVVKAVDVRNSNENAMHRALQADAGHNLNSNNVVRVDYIVRRLTPLECERLQGYPDGWTDIGDWVDSKGKKRKISDSARYKALGNSIALPCWTDILEKISAVCRTEEHTPTMASLFDGIGGFPLIWESINGKGSCLWASEIEEFPIAVTKKRIGGDDDGRAKDVCEADRGE